MNPDDPTSKIRKYQSEIGKLQLGISSAFHSAP